MNTDYELKETPIFDDDELYTSFTEWYQRVAEERTVFNEIIKPMKQGSKERIEAYYSFYKKIGMVSNDMFNEFTK